jgi:hypothetical protein
MNDLDYDELKAELRALHTKVNDLNGRLNGTAPARSGHPWTFSKARALRWSLAAGLLVFAGAIAQTSDPITVGPDGKVRMGKSLDVAETVSAKAFAGDGSGLTVGGGTLNHVLADKLPLSGGQITGKLVTKGAIEAGNSDIYFTNVDHDHSALGNKAGNAAIENSKNYSSLMILGRYGVGPDNVRAVRLYDRVGIGGSPAQNPESQLDVKGEIRGLPWRSESFYWLQGGAPVKMKRADRSVCFLTMVAGKFMGKGERVEITLKSDNYWYLGGESMQQDVAVRAVCIGAPDNSW